jgi:hypothetical protein
MPKDVKFLRKEKYFCYRIESIYRFFRFENKKMLSVLCNVDFEVKDRFYEKNNSYENLLECNYLKVINASEFYTKFVEFLIESGKNELRLEDAVKFVQDSLSSHATSDLTSLVISSLQAFAQINWLGPNTAARPNIPNALIDENEIRSNINFRVFSMSNYYGLNTEVTFEYSVSINL